MARIIDAILAINPSAKVVTRGSNIDTIEIDWLEGTAKISKEDIQTKLTELNNQETADAAAKETNKASGKAKLKSGDALTDAEIDALFG
jgi:hypothetical protein|tara:strand:+ start:1025 stop:1291 length:267 start_codon:yes stop_codon:yes gene_type:complete